MTGRWKYILAALLWSYSASPAVAYIVQDTGSAMAFQNYARSNPSAASAASSSQPVSNYKKVDDVVDRKAIARRMFQKKAKAQEAPRLDYNMERTSMRNLRLAVGNIFRIRLSEAENSNWKLDCDASIVQLLKSENDGTGRIMDFKVLRKGNTKIYLDNYRLSDSNIIQSRILRIKVGS